MNLTAEQQQAVEARGGDVIVTAGAGSGKTRVLVERYVSLLADYEIDQLVAVTFTDAAAAEMRGRVREAVMTRPELSRHAQNIDTAIIGTIHSLCLQMLRENPVEAGIDPAANVLGEDEAQVELLAACRDAVEAAAAGEGPGLEALLRLGVYSAQSSLPRMVERRDEVESAFAALGGDTAAEWERGVRRTLDDFIDVLIDETRPVLCEHRDFLTNAHVPMETDSLTPIVEEVLETLGDPEDGDANNLLERLEAVSLIPSPGNLGSRSAWFKPPKAVRDVVKAIRETYGAIQPFEWNDADAEALAALESLRGLFRGARDRYEARKRELSALDFLDLELKAIELLRTSPRTAADYRSRFKHVLVDESQDLNPTQFDFLELLTGADESTNDRPQRFFVGDKKQSIYRFRRSDVRYLSRLEDEIGNANGVTVSLDTSFRSHTALVNALNAVMTDALGEATEDYEAEMEVMNAVRAAGGDGPSVEVLPIGRDHADPDQRPRPTESQKRRMEAHIIAGRIRGLLDGEYPVWDRDKNQHRPAAPGDVTILMRGMIHADEYERALESHGIPCRAASGGNFYNRAEIIDLTNLLEWLAEPANDIALVGLLRSPFFAIDDQSLIALKEAPGSWLDALADPADGVLQQTRPLCQHAARVLAQLREESRLAAPEQLLETALVLTNYEASWTPLRGGDQALANIRQFVGVARTLADKTVDELVEHIRMLRDDLDARAPQAALDAVDAVRLLTIHSAKGLEFPIVFLADAGASRGGNRTTTVLWRAQEGISLTLEADVAELQDGRGRPAFYNYLRELERREEEAENKRLLYVAATRAADLLIVSGAEPANARDTWIDAFSAPQHADHVAAHGSIPVDLDAIKRSAPSAPLFTVPPAESEQAADTPLIGRRGAIPIRSSTPATALEHHGGFGFGGSPDSLALIRGTLAHAAIEEWFKSGARPDLRELAKRINARLSDDDLADVVRDVDGMLDDFDVSDLAATLRDPSTRKRFELPFSWAWDGVAVHGSIDLAYEAGGEWRVVDFKTDRVEKGREVERAASYLTQLGVYAGAIEAATGKRPRAGLMFLRTGILHWVSESDIHAALDVTRNRIDAGEVTLVETDETAEFADEPLNV